MNDFTKEELQHLYELAVEDEDFSINSNYQQFCEKLLVKIQEMIDNYPEICGLCNRYDCQECPCR